MLLGAKVSVETPCLWSGNLIEPKTCMYIKHLQSARSWSLNCLLYFVPSWFRYPEFDIRWCQTEWNSSRTSPEGCYKSDKPQGTRDKHISCNLSLWAAEESQLLLLSMKHSSETRFIRGWFQLEMGRCTHIRSYLSQKGHGLMAASVRRGFDGSASFCS